MTLNPKRLNRIISIEGWELSRLQMESASVQANITKTKQYLEDLDQKLDGLQSGVGVASLASQVNRQRWFYLIGEKRIAAKQLVESLQHQLNEVQDELVAQRARIKSLENLSSKLVQEIERDLARVGQQEINDRYLAARHGA